MPRPDVRDTLWTVAARFGFSDRELRQMPVSRLRFWYDGAVALSEHEQEALSGK